MSDSFFKVPTVENGARDTIRLRLETILQVRGEHWFDVYKDLHWHKSFASKILNGKLIPPEVQRIQLAKRLGVDSSAIWKIPEIIAADKVLPKICDGLTDEECKIITAQPEEEKHD